MKIATLSIACLAQAIAASQAQAYQADAQHQEGEWLAQLLAESNSSNTETSLAQSNASALPPRKWDSFRNAYVPCDADYLTYDVEYFPETVTTSESISDYDPQCVDYLKDSKFNNYLVRRPSSRPSSRPS